jgi:hypothetical protein
VSEQALRIGSQPGALSITEALRRAQAGDTAALSALRHQMDSSWWDEVTDLARNAEQSLVHALAGNNALLEGAVSQKLAVLKAELGGPSPKPLERLLGSAWRPAGFRSICTRPSTPRTCIGSVSPRVSISNDGSITLTGGISPRSAPWPLSGAFSSRPWPR